jgi:23S rRNA (cytidine1920-2'-O)/16S rRNA (cytidine1409-2'-O)-methyltransferase
MSRSKSNRPKDCPYVGKGGLKLEFGLANFGLSIEDFVCADLGCNVGGFTDCMLQHGASKVYAVDTSYGLLEWKLRSDHRVETHERTNVLHWESPELVDFAAADLGWTKQELTLPVIERILKPGGRALSLVKPQYERREWTVKGVFPEEMLPELIESVSLQCPSNLKVDGYVRSPYIGNGGNVEYWLLVERL